jgi:SAM-dependent methyltransferase
MFRGVLTSRRSYHVGMIGQFFRTLRRAGQMDPLHVTMTGVKMGERFLQIGCDDAALLAGLAAKVGLSGACAVVALDEETATRARAVGANVGALIDVSVASPGTFAIESASVDMVVVDDTRGTFARIREGDRRAALAEARRVLRAGGRIEVVERVAVTGLLGGHITRPEGYSVEADLTAAGFKPVRLLAEKAGVRFVEGLKGS